MHCRTSGTSCFMIHCYIFNEWSEPVVLFPGVSLKVTAKLCLALGVLSVPTSILGELWLMDSLLSHIYTKSAAWPWRRLNLPNMEGISILLVHHLWSRWPFPFDYPPPSASTCTWTLNQLYASRLFLPLTIAWRNRLMLAFITSTFRAFFIVRSGSACVVSFAWYFIKTP